MRVHSYFHKYIFALMLNFLFFGTVLSQKSQPDHLCQNSIERNANNICFDTSECSHQERIQTMCEIKNAMLHRYAPLVYKKEILSTSKKIFDPYSHLNQCIALEYRLSSSNQSLDFLDRVRQCLSAFKDSHLYLETYKSIPYVSLGLNLTETEDHRIRIANINTKILAYVRNELAPKNWQNILKVGHEIVAIDEQNIEQAIEVLSVFSGTSSPSSSREAAIHALTYRNFHFPQKNNVVLTVKSADNNLYTIAVPWVHAAQTPIRKDIQDLFERVNISKVKPFCSGCSGEEERSYYTPENLSGYSREKIILNQDQFLYLQDVYSERGETVFRKGVLSSNKILNFMHPPVCYLQVLTFNHHDVFSKIKDSRNVVPRESFSNSIAEFIKNECSSKNLDLILDLRSNPGGSEILATQFVRLFNKDEPGQVTNFKIFQTNRITAQLLEHEDSFINGRLDMHEDVQNAFDHAIETQQPYTDLIFLTSDDQDSSNESVFAGKIVTLVSPDCVSACDQTVATLKYFKKNLLLGTEAAGTGAGYSSESQGWNSNNSMIQLYMPDHLFGIFDLSKLEKEQYFPYSTYKNFIMENKATQPDIVHRETLTDLLNHGYTWYQKSIEILYHKKYNDYWSN